MPDISMCSGDNCPIRKKCYRHNAKPSEFRQSYFVDAPYDPEKKTCDYFWNDEKIKMNKNVK